MQTTPDQNEMFQKSTYPTRIAKQMIDGSRFAGSLSRAMKRAAEQSGVDRYELAKRMAKTLGQSDFSKTTLDAYISESKTNHNISVVRFSAFARATRCAWLWDFVVADDGLIVLDGAEARFAEIAKLEQDRDALTARIKQLKSKPVDVKRRQR